MDDLEQLKSWVETVGQHMPVLSKPQAVVLALWSFGIVVMQSSGLTTVTGFLAELLGCKESAMRQRLREWYWDEKAKKGEKRQELDVTGGLDCAPEQHPRGLETALAEPFGARPG
jgi:hypothetical protein